MKVFVGVRVVKVVSLADSRPASSLATACTLYSVARGQVAGRLPARAVVGDLALDRVALGVVDRDRRSACPWRRSPSGRRWWRRPWRRPSGVMVTTAFEASVAALSGASSPFALVAAGAGVRAAASAAGGDGEQQQRPAAGQGPRAGRVRAPTDAPDIGSPVQLVFSPRTAWSRPAPARTYARTARTLITWSGRDVDLGECHRSVPTCRDHGGVPRRPAVRHGGRHCHRGSPPSIPSRPCSSRRARCRGRPSCPAS